MEETKSVTIQLVKFGVPNENGDIIARGAYSTKNLDQLKSKGEIKDFEISDEGVTVTKEYQP